MIQKQPCIWTTYDRFFEQQDTVFFVIFCSITPLNHTDSIGDVVCALSPVGGWAPSAPETIKTFHLVFQNVSVCRVSGHLSLAMPLSSRSSVGRTSVEHRTADETYPHC